MITLVEKMATRNGFGWILGEGSYFETTMLGYWSPEKDVDAFAVEGKAKLSIIRITVHGHMTASGSAIFS